ncbi:hypothetical protein [Motilimonas cestriensis]|uniref:hypothetical protein n=1 Tax=Motilimonas cestriensis TaxID=2742685 RepID=UPI003DA1DA3D
MYKIVTKLITSLLLLFSSVSMAKQVVLVGLAHFPPFIEARGSHLSGLAVDMIDLMNAQQDKYLFKGVKVIPATRLQLFKLGRYDMSMFDSLHWGWQDLPVDASNVYLRGGEVYIAEMKEGRDHSYFSDFKNKTMVGVEGYHYAFADYNADADYLKQTFNMQLTRSNLGSILMILSGNRGDIAVVSKAFLAQYFANHPQHRERILVSDKMDQEYNHTIILRRGIKPDIGEINQLLKELAETGQLAQLFQNIQLPNKL